jgi:two-component system, OmpR family, phosphate regulon sensor histidine kinase PhoR
MRDMLQSDNDNKEKKIKKLIELNDELENYFRSTIIPQLFIDANLILRKYSPSAMKHFKLKEVDIGRSIKEFTYNIRFSTFESDIKEVIQKKSVLEKEIETADKRWYQMNIVPYIVYKENKTNGVIMTFVDITERIRSFRELQRLNTDHETFIYLASHDLKSPLINIEELIKNLKEEIDTHNIKVIVSMLDTSVKNLRNVINELTEISKVEGNYKEDAESIYFEDILHDVRLAMKDQIKQAYAQITSEFNAQEIYFSKKNLRSIVYNLLSNAVKYRSHRRSLEILIKTEETPDYFIITVQDNGIGIEEDKKEMVFSQFARIRQNVEGTGVGLYIVKKIVENTGGKIELESEPDKGTTLKIYLRKYMPNA